MDNGTEFGNSAINALCKCLDAQGSNLVVFISGYDSNVQKFLDKNEGLESRFPYSVTFNPYSEDELYEIFLMNVAQSGLRCEESSKFKEHIYKWIKTSISKPNFGYARTFGVRDAEMAIQRICSGKLVNQTGEENWMKIAISIDDVRKYLGEEPIPRGNFPSEAVSGVSKALAVSDNKGSTFAIETRLLEGEETLEITGLPKEMAVDSVRVAVTCIKKMYPNILDKKHIHVHFGEGSVQKDGPSAGVALFMSILSAALNRPIIKEKPYDISYTGELSLNGGIFAVGSIFQKIQAACDSGCSKVYIPEQNYERLDKDKISKYNCEVVPVANISEIVEDIYPELKEE